MPTVVIGNNPGDDYAGFEEVTLEVGDPNTNQDAGPFDPSKVFGSLHIHGVIRVTGISSLPSAIAVSAARIEANLFDALATNHVYTAKKSSRAWGETTATWNTWNGSDSWTTAGGLHETNDRSSTVSGTSESIPTTRPAYYELVQDAAQLRSDIEDFASGALTNNGWHIERTDAANDFAYRAFTSSEGTDGQRPFMSVTYTESEPPPPVTYYPRRLLRAG